MSQTCEKNPRKRSQTNVKSDKLEKECHEFARKRHKKWQITEKKVTKSDKLMTKG